MGLLPHRHPRPRPQPSESPQPAAGLLPASPSLAPAPSARDAAPQLPSLVAGGRGSPFLSSRGVDRAQGQSSGYPSSPDLTLLPGKRMTKSLSRKKHLPPPLGQLELCLPEHPKGPACGVLIPGGWSVLLTSVNSPQSLPWPRPPVLACLPEAALASPPGSHVCGAGAHSLPAEHSAMLLTAQRWTWHSLGEGRTPSHWSKPTFGPLSWLPGDFTQRGGFSLLGGH